MALQRYTAPEILRPDLLVNLRKSHSFGLTRLAIWITLFERTTVEALDLLAGKFKFLLPDGRLDLEGSRRCGLEVMLDGNRLRVMHELLDAGRLMDLILLLDVCGCLLVT